jgi:hypothetical protein
VVLERHPDHIGAPERLASTKPIIDLASTRLPLYPFSCAVVRLRPMIHWWRIQKVGEDPTKKVLFLFSVGNINPILSLASTPIKGGYFSRASTTGDKAHRFLR